MTMLVNHYLVLGLPTGEEGMRLTEREITKAFKAKALEVHPDKRPPDQAAAAHSDFQNLTASYQILIDAQKRQEFNALLSAHLRSQHQQQQRQQQQRQQQQQQQQRQQQEQQQQWRKVRIPADWRPNYEGEERKKRQKVRDKEELTKIKEKLSKFVAEMEKLVQEIEEEEAAAEETPPKPNHQRRKQHFGC